ncbi:MAG: hypothetical protein ABH956_03430 [Candidatus Nealsonbacteria bacterium]
MKINYISHLKAKKISIISILVGVVIGVLIGWTIQEIKAQSTYFEIQLSEAKELPVIQGNSVLSVSNPTLPSIPVQSINVTVTAYSSTPWQTDDTPFITASGERVRDGIIASNLLPFGTEVKIPELYGDKVFVVKDRMHWRMGYYRIDIWFPETQQAINFGKKTTYIEVLEN